MGVNLFRAALLVSDLVYAIPPNRLCESLHKHVPVKQDSTTQQVNSALSDGWMQGGSLLSSVLAGTLLGYLADLWLGTEPWLVVTGIVVGSYAGFMKIWTYMKSLDDDPRGR